MKLFMNLEGRSVSIDMKGYDSRGSKLLRTWESNRFYHVHLTALCYTKSYSAQAEGKLTSTVL